MFRLKRDYATKLPSQTRPRARQLPAKLAFPFYEDLTTANFKKMRAIAQDDRVQSCWSVAGQLRFNRNGEERVRKVSDIHDTVDNIIRRTHTATAATANANAAAR